MNKNYEHLLGKTVIVTNIQQGEFTCTSRGGIVVNVTSLTNTHHVKMVIGNRHNSSITVNKESAETLSAFFADVADTLT